MEREEGYYWVKDIYDSGWCVSWWDSDEETWWVIGGVESSDDSTLKEIGPKIEPPKEKITKDQFVSKLMKEVVKPLSGEDMIRSMEDMAKYLDNPIMEPQKSIMDAASFLTFNDESFKGYYTCGWIEIQGSTDQIKEIEERAKKLGLN